MFDWPFWTSDLDGDNDDETDTDDVIDGDDDYGNIRSPSPLSQRSPVPD